MLLRLFGAKVGAAAHPYPSATIWAPWNLVLGENSCLAQGVDCYSVAPIKIGRNVRISQRAYLCAASHDHRDPRFPLLVGEIEIGDGAWVASEAFVGPGVRVGLRAVIGARAVVTRDIGEDDIVAGNPARLIGKRNIHSER